MGNLPPGTITLLLTDIEGSTRLWEDHPVEMGAAVARHDEIIARSVTAHGGVLHKHRGEGDSTFAVFSLARQAVAAACTMQRGLHDEPWPAGIAIRVRAALHTGDADLRDGDLYGPTVNRCARLREIAAGGQTLISGATVNMTADALPDQAELVALGRHRLRDLSRPEDVFQLVHPDLPSSFRPLRSLDALPNNLPHDVDSFVGRGRELSLIADWFRNARLVTLTGPGGCGKTRLAQHVAADLLHDLPGGLPDGAWLVDLSALSEPIAVARRVAQVLRVPEAPARDPLDAVISARRNDRLLVLLDNCEHLLDVCSLVTESLLEQCPGFQILVTSREPLLIRGEHVYSVPTLTLPSEGASSREALRASEAVQLFVDRARLVRPSFDVTDANARTVAALCRTLDGVPLEIELAAGWVSALGLDQILERLRLQRFQILRGGYRTADDRRRSARHTIAWSWNLLQESERILFNRLAVFVGGMSLDAIEAVAGQSGLAWDDFDLVTALHRKSLIIRDEVSNRYRMLETVREFAVERLADSPDADQVHRHHGEYFIRLAEAAEPELTRPQQRAWLDRLETEHDNMMAALHWMQEASETELGLRLSGALWRYCYMRGHVAEGRENLERFLAQAAADEPSATIAKALHSAGTLAGLHDDFEPARSYLERAAAIRNTLCDFVGEVNSLSNLGLVAFEQGDFKSARDYYEQGLAIRRKLSDAWGVAASLCNIASVAVELGDYPAAVRFAEESLAIVDSRGDDSIAGTCLVTLAVVATDQGRYADAEDLLTMSIKRQQAAGDDPGVAQALQFLGHVASHLGEPDRAQALYSQCLAMRQASEDRQAVALVLEDLAWLAYDEGDAGSARSQFETSLTWLTGIDSDRTRAGILDGLGRACAALGDLSAAHRHVEDALDIRKRLGNPLELVTSIESQAIVSACEGRPDVAAQLAATASAERRRLGTPLHPARQRELAQRLGMVRVSDAGLATDQDSWPGQRTTT